MVKRLTKRERRRFTTNCISRVRRDGEIGTWDSDGDDRLKTSSHSFGILEFGGGCCRIYHGDALLYILRGVSFNGIY